LQEIYEAYQDKVDFAWIYIREAHPNDGHRPNKSVDIRQPQSFEEREKVAGQCAAALSLSIPRYLDDMKNGAATAYHAMPDRIFAVGIDGKIAYRGARGPRGFLPEDLEAYLKKVAALRGK